jgi:hypothetical protein
VFWMAQTSARALQDYGPWQRDASDAGDAGGVGLDEPRPRGTRPPPSLTHMACTLAAAVRRERGCVARAVGSTIRPRWGCRC